MWRLEQVVILHMDRSDHLCCLSLLGLLFALVLSLSLVLGVTLVSTTDCLLLSKGWQCLVLKRKGFLVSLDVESDLGISTINDSSSSVQEWSSQNDRQPLLGSYVNNYEVCRYVRVAYSHANLLPDSHWVTEWLICKLQTHGCAW